MGRAHGFAGMVGQATVTAVEVAAYDCRCDEVKTRHEMAGLPDHCSAGMDCAPMPGSGLPIGARDDRH